ncbi:helix-turn-helix domain-containing protein [Streptomyces sp. NPDC057445]|uniref:helix-turn-helix domain-containing protein n=1 Tax=Streptomyces sp. NPDC057445 TaxID=3346136 RepID=UPI0036C72EC9
MQASDPIASRQDFQVALAAFRARLERTAWKGIAGKTDLRNLIARTDICGQSGRWDHTVSERELAERMGCSRTTAHNSNQRLLEAKLLRQLDHGSPTEGARWMLISRTSQPLSQLWATHEGPEAGGVMSGPTKRRRAAEADISSRAASEVMHRDAFAHRGLGGSGLTILAALAERDGQAIEELQGTASVSRATVYRQAVKLQSLGLVTRQGELYHLSPAALEGIGVQTAACADPVSGWDDAARRLGTWGVGQRRRTRHEAERAYWRLEQVRLAERRRPAMQSAHPAVAQTEHVRADGCVVDPRTGEVVDGLYVASDGRWIWHDICAVGDRKRVPEPVERVSGTCAA